MRGTRPAFLVIAAAVVAAAAYMIVGTFLGAIAFHWTDLLFPWVLAAVCAWAARRVREAVEERGIGQDRSQMHPLTVARWLTVGTASAWLGALLAGGYLGVAVWLLPQWGRLAAATAEGPVVVAGAVTGVALAAAGLHLERCCQAPPGDDGPEEIPGAEPAAR
ncbi:DUF3180 domain-containing protein [Corynebacterium sp. 335C]